MRPEDVPEAQELSGQAFAALPSGSVGAAAPRPDAAARAWEDRARHLLRTDPAGCWSAVGDDGVLAGYALSLRREGLWGLSSFAVRPGMQGGGVGRELLARAAAYGAPALRGMICATSDARALRLYRAAGHRIHPAMRLSGTPDHAALPPVRHVREGGPGDLDEADAVDWLVRGSPHGPDHAVLARQLRLLLAETSSGRGYAYVGSSPGSSSLTVHALAATDPATARELLWGVLATAPAGTSVEVTDVTAEQDWAVDLALRAGLAVSPSGFVCVRGMKPPTPYVPSGAFL